MKKRILFVDDEPNVLQGLGRMLRNMRHEWDRDTAAGYAEGKCYPNGGPHPQGGSGLRHAREPRHGQSQGPAALEKRKALYDPDVLEALAAVLGMEARHQLVELKVRNLKPDMVLNQDVRTNAGQLVLSRGQEISPLLLKRLIAFTEKTSIQEPIRVYVPLDPPDRSRG